VNSFAGAWIDEDGSLVIALASMADSTSARDAFLEERSRAYRFSEKVAAAEAAQLRAPWSRVKFVRVTYAFSDLQRWKIAMAPALISTEGVSSIDVDEVHNAISVGISSARSADAVLRIGREAGAPRGALRVIEEVAAVEARQSSNLWSRHRPLTGGFELGRAGAQLPDPRIAYLSHSWSPIHTARPRISVSTASPSRRATERTRGGSK